MGDAARVIVCKAVIEEIREKKLVEQTVRNSTYSLTCCLRLTRHRRALERSSTLRWRSLPRSTRTTSKTCAERAKGELKFEISNEGYLANRGHRTYIAFDTKSAAAVTGAMKRLGVNIGACGKETIRLRPMLIFEESHSKSLVRQMIEGSC